MTNSQRGEWLWRLGNNRQDGGSFVGVSCNSALLAKAAQAAAIEAERDAAVEDARKARAEVERLREDEARNRWCEEKKADVNYGFHSGGVYVHEWFVQWDGIGTVHYVRHSDRNAAIDAAMRGGK